MELNVDPLGEPMRDSPEKGTAPGEPDAVLHDIGVQLRWGALQHLDNLAFYLGDGLVYARRYLLV